MKLGFLFPGQGAQSVGMGKELYEKYDSVKKIYDEVHKITGIDIAKVSFEGPEEMLNRTKYTQLAVLTNSLAILEVLKENGVTADLSAGLSLGEYTALINEGMISFEEGVELVSKRGECMEDYLPDGEWQMAAIIGMTDEQVEDVCLKVTKGFAVPANYNCVGQVVVSGEKEAVLEVKELAENAGARKLSILNTYGPFHTIKLNEASEKFAEELEKVNILKVSNKVLKNIDGKEYSANDDVKDVLKRHIVSPVRFSKIIENMINQGVDTFIEIGPGKTLSGFVKRTPTEKSIKILNINNVSTLEETLKVIKEEI